ncbi:hypothetical protein GXY_11107 [Novacetimonas hansenii ATCC 23769]|uniref:Uncharacterized protein n=1 Tax=Novacetimonas hansenii ATCC 23769 TaxID=714995 RepID=D5QGF0_NOVHA|nr:hypothetical protein GXY_11107 [Novacetimonas hansenii ATCC 23769]
MGGLESFRLLLAHRRLDAIGAARHAGAEITFFVVQRNFRLVHG